MLELFNSLKANYFASGLSAEIVNSTQFHDFYTALQDTLNLLNYSSYSDSCDLPQNARIVITDYYDYYARHAITILNYQTPWGKHEHILAVPDSSGKLHAQRCYMEI